MCKLLKYCLKFDLSNIFEKSTISNFHSTNVFKIKLFFIVPKFFKKISTTSKYFKLKLE